MDAACAGDVFFGTLACVGLVLMGVFAVFLMAVFAVLLLQAFTSTSLTNALIIVGSVIVCAAAAAGTVVWMGRRIRASELRHSRLMSTRNERV